MGISASQARLLSITARLTSNEYESQQISNAKMRLATQSQQVSDEYIAALNSKQLQFMTYDAQGSAVTADLTASSIYQYADMKNQYALINTSGQMLVASADAKNFAKAQNLEEFLALYGVNKEYKTPTIAQNVKYLQGKENYVYNEGAGDKSLNLKDSYDRWSELVDALRVKEDYTFEDAAGTTKTGNSEEYYQTQKAVSYNKYMDALESYQNAVVKYQAGIQDIDIEMFAGRLADAKTDYTDCVNYDNWLLSRAAKQFTFDENNNVVELPADKDFSEEYKNVSKYYEVLDEALSEAEDIGCTTIEDTYTYSDESKAQWYTNLWYRMNGESSDKSAQGQNAVNYKVLDSHLLSSKQWIQDSLAQGIITLEVASNEKQSNLIQDSKNPFSLTLRGINWNSTQYGSCSNFVEKDDDSAIAKAEAEYQRKNNEITAKDTKYQNKIKSLDIEHNTLQTQYESVQSAMNKNIERSYKTFNG